jgi:serine/threonine protein kinase
MNESLLTTSAHWHLPGDLIDNRYEIRAFIGEGATAQVFRAIDRDLGVEVAIKKLSPYLETDPISVERFHREIIAARQVNHPQVVAIYNLLTIPEGIYLIMEIIPGIDLKEKLGREGVLPTEVGVEIIRQLAEIMAECHRHGLIHRDLKPQNIIFSPDKRIRLLDFGIAKVTQLADLTRTGTALGSPEYMAPELFIENNYDLRTDIYAIGVIAYELMTGMLPFSSDSLAQLAHQQVSVLPTPPHERQTEIPAWVSGVILRCLKKEPIQRYQGCEELLLDMKRHAVTADRLESRTDGACIGCDADRLAGLSFCPHCGTKDRETDRQGDYRMHLHHLPDREKILVTLKRLFGPRLHPKAAQLIKRRRPLLADGLDREACEQISDRLKAIGCSVGIARHGITTWLLIIGRVGLHYLWIMLLTTLGSALSVGWLHKWHDTILATYAEMGDAALWYNNALSRYKTVESLYGLIWSLLGHGLFLVIAIRVIRADMTTIVQTKSRGKIGNNAALPDWVSSLSGVADRLRKIQGSAIRGLLASLITTYHQRAVRLMDGAYAEPLQDTSLKRQEAAIDLCLTLGLGIDHLDRNIEALTPLMRPQKVTEGNAEDEITELMRLQEQRIRLMNRLVAMVSEARLLAGLHLVWEEPITENDLARLETLICHIKAELELIHGMAV